MRISRCLRWPPTPIDAVSPVSSPTEPESAPSARGIRVLAFDTFGTVTDWLSGISSAIATEVPDADAWEVARQWRRRYGPILARVESGELPWRGLDALQTETLHDVAESMRLDLDAATTARLVHAWRTIPGWPDAGAGLARLRRRFTVCALSNASVAMLTEMAKHNGFGWDFIGGADLWHHYKPSPHTYLGLAALMEVQPGEVMMVATHQSDLDAARSHGLRTAFIERPLEWGEPTLKDDSGSPANTVHACDILDLADQLGC